MRRLCLVVLCLVLALPMRAAAAAPACPLYKQYYTIRRGDTLWGIARRCETPMEVLIIANHLRNPDRIFAGQRLLVPAPVIWQLDTTATESTTPAPATIHQPRGVLAIDELRVVDMERLQGDRVLLYVYVRYRGAPIADILEDGRRVSIERQTPGELVYVVPGMCESRPAPTTTFWTQDGASASRRWFPYWWDDPDISFDGISCHNLPKEIGAHPVPAT